MGETQVVFWVGHRVGGVLVMRVGGILGGWSIRDQGGWSTHDGWSTLVSCPDHTPSRGETVW